MSISVMTLVWKFAPYQGNTLLTLLALADWSDDDGKSWPSVEKLAEKSRQSERNVQYILRRLESNGILKITSRRDNSSVYTINLLSISRGAKISSGANSGTLGVQTEAQNMSQLAPNTSLHTIDTSIPICNDFALSNKQDGGSPLMPEWLPLAEWGEWLAMRKEIRKPATKKAQKYAIDDLAKLYNQGHDITEIIKNAIKKNWLAFYAPQQHHERTQQYESKAEQRQRAREDKYRRVAAKIIGLPAEDGNRLSNGIQSTGTRFMDGINPDILLPRNSSGS